jgi:flagellar hook-basal body complex protein FliE
MAINVLSAADGFSSQATAQAALARTNPLHYTADGRNGAAASGAVAAGAAGKTSFEDVLLSAMDGVDAYQSESSDLIQMMSVDPDSVDVQDVTIAMAEANLSLNLARTILDRATRAWKEVINTR